LIKQPRLPILAAAQKGSFMAAPVSSRQNFLPSGKGVVAAKGGKSFAVRDRNGRVDNSEGEIQFKVTRVVGKGGFGEVTGGFVEGHASPRVVKQIPLPEKPMSLPWNIPPENLLNEFKVLLMLEGVPHCMQLRGGIQDSESLHVVSDLIPRENLYTTACKNQIPTSHIRLIFWQVLAALREVHKRNIIHCDVKPENLMFDPDSKHTMLIDFGLSLRVLKDQQKLTKGHQGTGLYMSPEMLLEAPFTYENDLVGWGISLFELYADRKDNSLLKLSKEFQSLPKPQKFKPKLEKALTIFGPPPASWLKKSSVCNHYFTIDEKTGQIVGKERLSVPPPYDWRGEIREAALKRGDPPEIPNQIIALLERIFVYENRITAQEASKSPLFQNIYGFKISCSTNLSSEWKLTLFEKTEKGEEEVASYPLRQWVNDTMFHLYNQQGRLGGLYRCRLTAGPDDLLFASGEIELRPDACLHLRAEHNGLPNEKYGFNQTPFDLPDYK
jgi:serine/threonine protein kinase